MNEWRKISVDEIKANSKNAAVTGPFGSSIGSKFFLDAGVPVIRGSNLSEDISTRLIDQDLVFISHEKALEFSRSIARKGDLIFTCWGTIAQVGIIDDRSKFSEYVISNKQMKLTPAPEVADSLFLYYLFSSPQVRKQILQNAIGSSVPGFNLGQLKSITLTLPPLPEQKRIKLLLDGLDRKIENLRRQNETLERIAQTLFKHWFVDFEFPNEDGKPYKSSGGEMVRSELGEIPVGWRVGKLGEIYKTTSGGTPSRKESEYYAEEGIPWVKSKELYSTFVLDTEEKITLLGLKRSSAKLLPEKTILIAMYGATVGQVSILGTESTCNQAICAVLEQNYSNHFVYLWLKHTQQKWTGMAIGSAQQNLSQVLISKIDMVIPALDINSQFKDIVSPIFQKMLIHSKQIQTLTKIRDVLLPKLMSGKLRITE